MTTDIERLSQQLELRQKALHQQSRQVFGRHSTASHILLLAGGVAAGYFAARQGPRKGVRRLRRAYRVLTLASAIQTGASHA